MPVLFDSSASKAVVLTQASTSGSATVTHNVNSQATNTVAVVGIMLLSGVTLTGATFGVTFGGQAMTVIGTPQYWDTNKSVLTWFSLASPPAGADSVVVSVASIPTGTSQKELLVVSGTWANVASIGTPVDASITSTVSNAVTVPSVAPAHSVVTLHGVGHNRYISAYDKVKRAGIRALLNYFFPDGELILGEAPGAASVVATATNDTATALWGAKGIPLTPVVVDASATLTVAVATVKASGGIYRTALPAPERTWVIKEHRPDSRGGQAVLPP